MVNNTLANTGEKNPNMAIGSAVQNIMRINMPLTSLNFNLIEPRFAYNHQMSVEITSK